MQVDVVEIEGGATLALRQQVLWPDRPLSFSRLEFDEAGTHFGALLEGELVGVVSVFKMGDAVQLRKLAVAHGRQRQGIGSALMDAVQRHAKSMSVATIYCDSRETAKRFYEHHGFVVEGERFEKHGLPYVRMVLRIEA